MFQIFPRPNKKKLIFNFDSIAHVPWGESLAAAAAAAIASTSSLAGPSGTLGVYNIQAPSTAPPVIAPVRGKQRNS
jgi:hypothetical protein